MCLKLDFCVFLMGGFLCVSNGRISVCLKWVDFCVFEMGGFLCI